MEGKNRGRGVYRSRGKPPRRFPYNRGSFRGTCRSYSSSKVADISYKPYKRPASPIEGTEEYMTRKIKQTSAIIMRHLLSPDESRISSPVACNKTEEFITISDLDDKLEDQLIDKSFHKPRKNNLSAKEIHEKIINHITNLNTGRQKNFINANSSTGLDDAIDHMQKQKRLEISRVLRDMNFASNFQKGGAEPDSIVPDIGIKIEDLPIDVIEELRHTLNLDLEHLDEAIASEVGISPCNSISIKQEPIDCSAVEVEQGNEETHEVLACSPVPLKTVVKDEVLEENESLFEASTIARYPSTENQGPDSEEKSIIEPKPENKSAASPEPKQSLEDSVCRLVEQDASNTCQSVNECLKKMKSLDSCLKYLASYRESLTETLDELFRTQEDSKSSPAKEIQPPVKRPKVSHSTDAEPSDLFDIEHVLRISCIQERITGIERVEDQLLLATEKGNIVFLNTISETVVHNLDVTESTITSMLFVNGLNDFVYMYVGSLENVLRVYDFRKRKLLKASGVNDQIICMDSMWDYVFMGCKNGTLIRYSCKKERIEFEEKNVGPDILVLKASQEGPRKVLLVGHREAPIYIRDAMSGLCLRNFSNEAITPTVFSLVLNKNDLYCGTARDNILIFSFHQGYLKGKIVADDSKGISCMKLRKNLLFAGCFNGSVYVYDARDNRHLATLRGPGGGIQCMEVLKSQIIVATLTRKIVSIELPTGLS